MEYVPKSNVVEIKKETNEGRIELITGPMFAGKTTEMLRRVTRHEISGKICVCIKY